MLYSYCSSSSRVVVVIVFLVLVVVVVIVVVVVRIELVTPFEDLSFFQEFVVFFQKISRGIVE